jgi:NAD(P)-dependent dehydrogenase (short-subunit alcohol dehydrogenase family)
MQDLAGKVAVVTGGGSGIGQGMCRAFAAAGMRVVVADIQLAAAEAVAADARDRGAEAVAARVDVSSLDSLEELASFASATFGGVRLLCNNAGVSLGNWVPFVETRPSDWSWIVSVNLTGVANGLFAFLPGMRAQEGSKHIVNTASHGGLAPVPGHSAYTATKYGVVGLSETLGIELADEGFVVSVLCPGTVHTNLSDAQRNRDGERHPKATIPMPDADGVNVLDPDTVGALVLEAVLADRRYIYTHDYTRDAIRARTERLLQD